MEQATDEMPEPSITSGWQSPWESDAELLAS